MLEATICFCRILPFDFVYPNTDILDEVRAAAYRPHADILRSLDRDLVRGAFAGEHFMEYFSRDCKDKTLLTFVKDCRR